jgi:hypothetical protein
LRLQFLGAMRSNDSGVLGTSLDPDVLRTVAGGAGLSEACKADIQGGATMGATTMMGPSIIAAVGTGGWAAPLIIPGGVAAGALAGGGLARAFSRNCPSLFRRR